MEEDRETVKDILSFEDLLEHFLGYELCLLCVLVVIKNRKYSFVIPQGGQRPV